MLRDTAVGWFPELILRECGWGEMKDEEEWERGEEWEREEEWEGEEEWGREEDWGREEKGRRGKEREVSLC